MDDGLLSLKWNNHKTTFFEILKLLRDKANYTDATLAVDGKFYPVHKLVLSTCSEYFSEIFERTPCKSPVIVLKDVRSQDLESLLDYMYLGEVNVNQNDLALLLKTAECLRIKGLAVPDDDPITRHSTSTTRKYNSQESVGESRETPPPKKRKEDVSGSFSVPSPSRISPSSKIPSSPHNSSVAHNKSSTEPASPNSNADTSTASVKVELDENEDEESAFEANYDSNAENENREFTVEKSEIESRFPANSNYPVATSQSGDITWEDGENSFPQDSFGGGDTSNQQTGGEDDEEDVDVTSLYEDGVPPAGIGSSSFLPLSLSLTQSKEARRCQLCQVTLANANLLRRHVEDHHFHIRKYDCVHCGKKFKRKEHRERHERIHTGEKPFACHICSSRFTQKEHLKGHIENVHNKHMKDREKENSYLEMRDHDNDRDATSSSPPSLASPSSLASLMSSPLASILPSTTPLSTIAAHLSVPSPPSILPNRTSDDNTMTAIYAPVTRKTVNSPNKHVQTITINFN